MRFFWRMCVDRQEALGYSLGVDEPQSSRTATSPFAPGRRSILALIVAEGRTFPLIGGDYVIGRTGACDLVIDGTRVSRAHARITVADGETVIRDLGSMNGVIVNGVRIEGSFALHEGDVVVIGTRELPVVLLGTSERLAQPEPEELADDLARYAETEPPGPPPGSSRMRGRTEFARQAAVFAQLSAVANRVIAEDRLDDAIRTISVHMRLLLDGVRNGCAMSPDTLAAACDYALIFAEKKSSGPWVDYVVELHATLNLLFSERIVERVEALLREGLAVDRDLLMRYQSALRPQENTIADGDRELLSRILGLLPRS